MKNVEEPVKRTIVLLLAALWCFSTTAQTTFEKADSIAAEFSGNYENVEELALKLTSALTTEEEKARVLFMWIAHHVRYDCGKYHNPSPPQFKAKTKEKLREEMNKWKELQIEKTLKNKKGVCGDYSQLFKALCDAAGLEAVIITGKARDFYKPYSNAHDNLHAWNAVKVGNTWHLLDVTWGAGYTDAGVTKFYRRVSPGFFFTPANLFSQNHYPDEEKWQLLDEPLTKNDFADQPMVNYGQMEYRIIDFAPIVEIVPEKKNERKIWLLFEHVPKELMVTDRKGNPIKFQRTDIEGKVILTFSGSAAGSVNVFAGNSLRSRMEWMAMYEL